ncbi:YdcF family protein [Lactiplantibacillus sp. WILCCON 0030]|uniref:YdcF family protein n=1 Tax=Lactiplantibacillus brownii TaxID=3069269 RepID=A0ABU1ACM5_9LACO|nr:YdcF family protein [Lactiplantibacillus brownii]MDQ7938596.1 YdcF family protein [Lactiplantibacillus brownii]
MSELTDLNRCLAWLTKPAPKLADIDGLVLCGNSLPLTAQLAARVATEQQLPTLIIAGGIGHATKYLRQNMGVTYNLSEAELMATLVRQAGYHGKILQDRTSTNTGTNASHALALAPTSWRKVLLVQDPLLALRTQLTFEQVWGASTQLTRLLPPAFQLSQLEPIAFGLNQAYQGAWRRAYFTELLLGEIQRLWDTPQGYGPLGTGFIRHIDCPENVTAAYQRLLARPLHRER